MEIRGLFRGDIIRGNLFKSPWRFVGALWKLYSRVLVSVSSIFLLVLVTVLAVNGKYSTVNGELQNKCSEVKYVHFHVLSNALA